jgi:hypothetical protein
MLCSGCGQPADETLDDEIRAAWVAEPVVCWSCAAKERVLKRATSQGRDLPPGTKFRTVNRAKAHQNGR